MKKINILIFQIFLLFLTSCEKDELIMPEMSFSISSNEVSINETVKFEYTGTNSEQVVVFTGDDGHNYELKGQGNSGLVMNKGLLTYSYKKAGIYNVVFIATNYNNKAEDMLYAVDSVKIIVNDDNVELRNVSLRKDLYLKELQAQIIDDNRLLFAVPYKVRVSNKDIPVSLSKQRVNIEAMSNSAIVKVNNMDYDENIKYDLTKPFNISLISPSGITKTYTSEVLNIPVFEHFSIDGVEGTVAYSDFYFDKTFITLEVPEGTDLKNLRPEFSSLDAKQIMIDEQEQISGETIVDFTEPVVYTLKTWKDGDENVAVESFVEINIVH